MDISDNAARCRLILKLAEAASEGSLPPFSMWSSVDTFSESGSQPQADIGGKFANAGIGEVWQRLNSLRVMAQYTRTLGSMCDRHPFLHAHPTTCINGLEWLSRFLQPVQAPCPEVLESIRAFRASPQAEKGLPDARLAFEYHQRLILSDRDATRALIAEHFPAMNCKEYEVDICAYMLSPAGGMDYHAWLAAFPAWRDSGLFFPLALSAAYMPHLGSWLPAGKRGSPFADAFQACLNALGSPARDRDAPLRALAMAWASDQTGASQVVAATLDRVAVLMGVKSNGRDAGGFSLASALAAFPRSFGAQNMHESNYRAWHAIRPAIEAAFPPSLLLAPCVRPRRPTWGYPCLTLEVLPASHPFPLLRFAECSLQRVDPDGGPLSPIKDCLLNQTPHRIQDVLWRLGEVATSPEVALCMLHPRSAMAELEEGAGDAALLQRLSLDCSDRQDVIRKMAGQGRQGLASSVADAKVCPDYADFTRALDATVPPVVLTRLPQPRTVLMWRLDIPSRAVIYTGTGAEVDPASESQHHLRKVLLNSKVHQRPIGGIAMVPPRSDESTLRDCLRHFAASELAEHPSNTVLVKAGDASEAEPGGGEIGERQVTPVACTTLAESVACFALRPPTRVTRCPLNGSCAWKENGIDPRYAERQQAQNGARYRDWVAIHAGRGGTQQSRLASHFVEYDAVYSTQMPWIREDGSLAWVRVSSTSPPDSKTLHGKSLRHAVETRFLHDLRMLPSPPSPLACPPKVERSNAEIYTADSGAKVAIAYAPSGHDKIEFVVFECA